MNRDSLKALLVKHEGLRLKPYKDSMGLLTIGVGRCLDTAGITEQEAMALLDNDISFVVARCRTFFVWFNSLSDNRQNVVCDMAFNMGVSKLLEFKQMLAAIASGNFKEAASQMLDSAWAKQVGSRATELSQMMIDG